MISIEIALFASLLRTRLRVLALLRYASLLRRTLRKREPFMALSCSAFPLLRVVRHVPKLGLEPLKGF
jgi:hypothetical protein